MSVPFDSVPAWTTVGQEDDMGGKQTRQWRAIFVSDLHLGTHACQAENFLAFLRGHDADAIYLVGDIVDFWRMARRTYWTQAHNDVVQKLLRKARKGTRIVLVPGNHDEAFDDFLGWRFGNIDVKSEAVHETASGLRLLVMHGDQFDGVVYYARSLVWLGDLSYAIAMWVSGPVTAIRSRLGLRHWSLAAYLKKNFKQAVDFIDRFEKALASEAERRGFDGIVCGHIHHAADKTIGGIYYLNCGDWVESCTALAEDREGRIWLLWWTDQSLEIKLPPLTEADSCGVAIAA
jgi:UDP-2,3-diacylglucosamine pyrophosphatase LpxH